MGLPAARRGRRRRGRPGTARGDRPKPVGRRSVSSATYPAGSPDQLLALHRLRGHALLDLARPTRRRTSRRRCRRCRPPRVHGGRLAESREVRSPWDGSPLPGAEIEPELERLRGEPAGAGKPAAARAQPGQVATGGIGRVTMDGWSAVLKVLSADSSAASPSSGVRAWSRRIGNYWQWEALVYEQRLPAATRAADRGRRGCSAASSAGGTEIAL